MDIGGGFIRIPQFPPNSPMPVGTNTIPPAEPNAKDKPGYCSERNRYQMDFSCFEKDPSHYIKNSKNGMEYKEENIQEGVPNHVF
jgi:hypothetical protein